MTPDEVLAVIRRAERGQGTELDLSGRELRILGSISTPSDPLA